MFLKITFLLLKPGLSYKLYTCDIVEVSFGDIYVVGKHITKQYNDYIERHTDQIY